MEIIPSDFQIQNRLAARDAIENPEEGQLGRNAFLQLLLTQLENQDPLSPMQDHEFVAQLATFSSLEQLESINTSMQASLLMNQSVNNSLATNLIGKEVLADGSIVRLQASGSPALQVKVDGAAKVTVLVRDERGNLVKRIEAGDLAEGAHRIVWDGTNQSGSRATAGNYKFEVSAVGPDGSPVTAAVKIRAVVTGVRFEGGSGFLVVGEQLIPLSSVQEVFAAPAS